MSAGRRLARAAGVRAWRLRALGVTALRVLAVLSVTAVVLGVWFDLLGVWLWLAACVGATLQGLVVLAAIRRGRRSAARSGPPPGAQVTLSIGRACRAFGINGRRVRSVVVDLGGKRGRGLPLAAATSGLFEAVVLVDDDLEAKARLAPVGSVAFHEVDGVIAHEIAHIFAHDVAVKIATSLSVLFLSWAACLGALAALAGQLDGVGVGVLSVGSVLAALVVDRALSRAAEYKADARAGVVTGRPDALASALARDFGGRAPGWRSVLATHPPTSRRCERLARLSGR